MWICHDCHGREQRERDGALLIGLSTIDYTIASELLPDVYKTC